MANDSFCRTHCLAILEAEWPGFWCVSLSRFASWPLLSARSWPTQPAQVSWTYSTLIGTLNSNFFLSNSVCLNLFSMFLNLIFNVFTVWLESLQTLLIHFKTRIRGVVWKVISRNETETFSPLQVNRYWLIIRISNFHLFISF